MRHGIACDTVQLNAGAAIGTIITGSDYAELQAACNGSVSTAQSIRLTVLVIGMGARIVTMRVRIIVESRAREIAIAAESSHRRGPRARDTRHKPCHAPDNLACAEEHATRHTHAIARRVTHQRHPRNIEHATCLASLPGVDESICTTHAAVAVSCVR